MGSADSLWNTRRREDSTVVCKETSRSVGRERKMGENPWKTCKENNAEDKRLGADLRSWALKFWLWAGCEACQTFSTCAIDNSTLTRGSIFKTFCRKVEKIKNGCRWCYLLRYISKFQLATGSVKADLSLKNWHFIQCSDIFDRYPRQIQKVAVSPAHLKVGPYS